MARRIIIEDIVNGYISSSLHSDFTETKVYHKDMDSLFKHLTEIYNNKTNLTYTGEINYNKSSQK